jgi:hypothetical protein
MTSGNWTDQSPTNPRWGMGYENYALKQDASEKAAHCMGPMVYDLCRKVSNLKNQRTDRFK